jgi:transcriptional regulator with XRE-family HTH domain
MRSAISPTQFEDLYIARVKALREARDWTAAQMATALDIPAERYRKYESRTPLPHSLMERFALITGVSIEFLITGRRVAGKGPYPGNIPGPHDLD